MALQLGVVTRSFPGASNEEVARLLAENGFQCTELCFKQRDSDFWVYNGRSDLSSLSEARCHQIVACYRSAGVEVVSLGVFTNLMEPDPAELRANLDYFQRHMQLASHCGVPFVSTETGFVPGRRGINADTYEADFQRLADVCASLSHTAGRLGVRVCLETCVLDPIPSAKRARDFLSQVASAHLKVLLDPANLIANSSEHDMFAYLSDRIGYFHGKDRLVNDARGRVIGDGDIDWPLFLQLYHQHTDGLPFILEYVNRDNFLMVADRVRAADRISALAALPP